MIDRMLAMRSSGCSLRAIAALLNEEIKTTPRGDTWTAVQVARVLARETSVTV